MYKQFRDIFDVMRNELYCIIVTSDEGNISTEVHVTYELLMSSNTGKIVPCMVIVLK